MELAVDPLQEPKWENWMLPVPEVILHGDKFRDQYECHADVGLQNLVNTCYLNSSVQALLHVPVFVNWLMDDKYHYNKCRSSSANYCVTCTLSFTIKKLLGGGKVVSPEELCSVLGVLGLKWGSQEDANDFMVSLLDTMSEEYLQRYPDFDGALDYCSKFTTATGLLFGFWVKSEVKCSECKYTSTTYACMQEVQIELSGTVQQGLIDHFKREDLPYKCEFLGCKKETLCSRVVSPYNTPHILMIQFTDNMDKNCDKVVVNKIVKFGNCTYELRSVIAHLGTSLQNGHYIAYAKCPDNTWSYFSDTKILHRKCNDLDGGIIRRNAYILLYQKTSEVKAVPEFPLVPKEVPKMSSSMIGQQPFLISPMKRKEPDQKLSESEVKRSMNKHMKKNDCDDLADPLTWSSDEADGTPIPPNPRRRNSVGQAGHSPLKMTIRKTLHPSPIASSSQSAHDYNIVRKDMAAERKPSPIKIKISRKRRLSPKANSAQSEHIYKVQSPLKKMTIERRKRLSPKANSSQSEHVYNIRSGNGALPTAPNSSPQPQTSLPSPQKSLEHLGCGNNGVQADNLDRDLFSDFEHSPEKNAGSHNISTERTQVLPPIWNVELYESEVQGAILPRPEVDLNKREDLQRWLQCRGMPYGANKPQLIELVKACIASGDSHLLDVKVDNGFPYRMKLQRLYPKQNAAENNESDEGWGPFVSVPIPKSFNYGNIYHYLVESAPQLPVPEHGPSQEEIFDALESGEDDFDGNLRDPFEESEYPCILDEKPLRRGMNFLKSGHVHTLTDKMENRTYRVKASVASSMPRPDKKVGLSISAISGTIQDAYCCCKASALGRCSHISALLLFILRHVKLNGYDGMYQVVVWSGKLITVLESTSPQYE